MKKENHEILYLWAIPLGYLEERFEASMVVYFIWKKSIYLRESQSVLFRVITTTWQIQKTESMRDQKTRYQYSLKCIVKEIKT
jgi:hypothetical protein